MFTEALSMIAKLRKQTKCASTNNKDDVGCACVCVCARTRVYIYNGILLSHQKEWNLAICNNVDGTTVYYAKQNKSVRETQIPFDFTNVEFKETKQMNIGEGKEK